MSSLLLNTFLKLDTLELYSIHKFDLVALFNEILGRVLHV